MRKAWRSAVVIGSFLLPLWLADEGDYETLKSMAFILAFALPVLCILWWELGDSLE